MKKFWQIFGCSVLGLIVIAYLGFLFVLPNVVDINKFKPDIQAIAKEQGNLSVDFENAKIITTPLLGAGIKLDNLSVKLPDDSLLFSADSIKTRVAIPSLFVLTAKVSCFEVNNPFVNLEIAKNDKLKVIQFVEDILNQNKEQTIETRENPEPVEKSWFNPNWIRVKVPNIVLNNYKVLVKDLKTNHYLELKGEQLKAGYFNGKVAKVKTYAEIFSDENRNVTANVAINTFLPPPAPALDSEDDPAERIEIPVPNLVNLYRTYDLKADLDTRLKIRERNGEIKSRGYFNLENLTFKVAHLTIPSSYIKAKTFGTNVDLDTNLYLTQEQNIEIFGKFNYGKHPKTDLNIKTAEIKFNDVLDLGKAFLTSLNIPNELNRFTANGSLKADCYIKTNFKKLKSNGTIIVQNGGVNVRGIGNVISNANINVLLDNNILDVKDSSLYVNNSPIVFDGRIDEKSVADIKINAERIQLPLLFNAFAPQSIRNSYNFRSGDLNFNLSLQGELKKAVASLNAGLKNLNISDRDNNFVISDNNFKTEFFMNSKDLKGNIKNDGLRIFLPLTRSQITLPLFETDIAENNIIVKENLINFNDKSSIKYFGEVINYNKLESLKLNANGNILTDDIIKLIGKEYKPFVHSKGTLPVKVTVEGNGKKQTLFAQILSNQDNFITPVDFAELKDKNVSLQSVVDFKGNRIKVKKTGLFTRVVNVDEEGNEVVSLDEIVGIDGTLEGNRINLIKLTMPKSLTGSVYVFPRSKFNLGGKAFVFGETSAPRIRGGFNVQNLSIPELLLDMRNFGIKFRSRDIDLAVDDLILNGSDIQAKLNFNLLPAQVFTINRLDFSSRYMNIDKLMAVVERAMKYVPQSPANSSAQAQSADIPVAVRNGSVNLARIVTGNINVFNTTSRMNLRQNVLYLNNLKTQAFDGNVKGNISVNLVNMLLNISLQGTGVDVEKAMLDAAGMKDMLSGTAEFETDISLGGVTLEEQMKSLKGTVDFSVKDGQFGPFGKLENLILAENIRESQFFQSTIGNMLSGLFTIDTTHFSELAGSLSFNDGICHIEPITSSGNILALHVFGDFDLIENKADMKVRARMASLVSNLLGPLNAINPVNLLNSAASLNVVTAKAFSLFCETVPEEELAVLPSFSNKYVDNAATKFQIVVRGDVAKPLTLVKSFKWLTTPMQFKQAEDFVATIPEPVEGNETASIEQAVAEAEAHEAEMKTVGYKIKHLFSRE